VVRITTTVESGLFAIELGTTVPPRPLALREEPEIFKPTKEPCFQNVAAEYAVVGCVGKW
jgi:hypothetical protein